MSRVAITGGAGFIGSALASRLHQRGLDVVVIDNLHPQVHPDPAAARRRVGPSLREVDIRDASLVERACDGVDVVVHLAAETGVGQSMTEATRYREVNVDGSLAVARAAVTAGATLVMLSSRAVYGNGAWECPHHGRRLESPMCADAMPAPSLEDDVLCPVSVYGETKAEAEAAVGSMWPAELPLVILRPQNVIGPGQSLTNPYTGVLAAFLARLKSGLPPLVYGDGEQTRDFIHIHDMVSMIEWVIDGCTAGAVTDLTLNVGSGRRTTLNELAHFSISASGLDLEPEQVQVHRDGDISHACADLTRVRELAAPTLEHDVAGAVSDFISWGWEQQGADPEIWDRVVNTAASVEGLDGHGE